MKLGSYVQCTKISPEFACQGQGQGHRGQKTKKCDIFSGVWGTVLVQHFFQERFSALCSASSMPVGKPAHAV